MEELLRKVYKYVKTPTTMGELKAGDVFSMDPFDENDPFQGTDVLFVATTDAVPEKGRPEGFYEVKGFELVKVLPRDEVAL